MQFIDSRLIHEILSYRRCADVVREAMIELSNGLPPMLRTVFEIDPGSFFGCMPGYTTLGSGFFGAKLVSVYTDPAYPSRNRHGGVVILFDRLTGKPVCLADAEAITTIRTAAASAVATEALAREDAHTLAILGCGTQAEAHIRALTSQRRYSDIVIWGRSPARAQELAESIACGIDAPLRIEESVKDAVANADVICTVTSATRPLLERKWVRPGTHINAVGSSIPAWSEIAPELVAASRYIADSRPSVLAQAGEFIDARTAGLIGDDHIAGEIGEVLAGHVAGRQSRDQITLYKSLGHVVQDLAAAAFVREHSLAILA